MYTESVDNLDIYGAQKKYMQTVNTVSKTATIVKLNNTFTKEWIFEGGVMGDVELDH